MSFPLAAWRALIRPGDVLVAFAGLVLCGYAFVSMWQGGRPETAIVRAGGKLVAELDLALPQVFEVRGPLGMTRIEIQPWRTQYWRGPGSAATRARPGWLTQAGAVAICAPNQVSLSLSGRGADYDSLNY